MSSHLIVERIASEEELRQRATPEELSYVEQFGSSRRRCESLSWRAIVRRELGQECQISYDEYGAPTVDAPNIHISVSHSCDRVAVLFSNRECAVDIECRERNFRRVSTRYLSVSEQSIAEHYDIYAEMWCAKEALYKLYKKGNLDFVEHISIHEYRKSDGVLLATILDGEPKEVKIKRDGDVVVALIDG